jgi:methyl-accepting chemotaxis protein-2 (aspartate sensor receptor)
LGTAVVLVLVVLGVVAERSSVASAQGTKLESSIFSYDGQDFVRTKTTLLTADGKSAVNTKLDHDSPAYKALVQKHSYTGPATVFGKAYDASYAPLTSDDGKLTGALFVATAK